MDSRNLGIAIIVLGAAAVAIGLLVYAGGMNWFGRLPGDIRIERGTTRVYVPLASMIVVSIALSLLLSLLRRLL